MINTKNAPKPVNTSNPKFLFLNRGSNGWSKVCLEPESHIRICDWFLPNTVTAPVITRRNQQYVSLTQHGVDVSTESKDGKVVSVFYIICFSLNWTEKLLASIMFLGNPTHLEFIIISLFVCLFVEKLFAKRFVFGCSFFP